MQVAAESNTKSQISDIAVSDITLSLAPDTFTRLDNNQSKLLGESLLDHSSKQSRQIHEVEGEVGDVLPPSYVPLVDFTFV